MEKEINEQKNKLQRIKKAYINGVFELKEYDDERKIVEKAIQKLENELNNTDCAEELRFTPKDILLKRDIDFINKIKLNKEYQERTRTWNDYTRKEQADLIMKYVDDIFEQARIEYNEKQTREDRKINDYFKHISKDKQKDLACEFIVELGDMDFWNDKDMTYRMRMINVFKEQIQDLMKIVSEFKIANAVIHFDEISPHLHLVEVPIKDNYKKGMRKQPAKSKVFTKESLQRIQDEMRNCCIKSYNKVYCENSLLKKKQKGRNRDINIKDMGDYREIKKQLKKKEERLKEANNQTKKIEDKSKTINEILENLKTTKLNKNNMLISNEDVEKL